MNPRAVDLTMMTAIGTAVFSSVVSAAYTIAGAECPPIVNVFILI
jgi:hypothetical protein